MARAGWQADLQTVFEVVAERRRVVRPAIFEGPFSEKLAGWRHYMLWIGNKRATYLSRPSGAWKLAETLQAEYFREGTWEAVTMAESAKLATAGRFAEVSPALREKFEAGAFPLPCL